MVSSHQDETTPYLFGWMICLTCFARLVGQFHVHSQWHFSGTTSSPARAIRTVHMFRVEITTSTNRSACSQILYAFHSEGLS